MEERKQEKPKPYKVAMVGASGVGKTAIVTMYTQHEFSENHVATIGTSYSACRVELENKTVLLNIWDTAGEEKFWSLIPLYLRNADACVIVFSLVDKESFQALDEIYAKTVDKSDNVYMVLCGNMVDKVDVLNLGAFEDWANAHNLKFFATSAKTGEGLSELFMDVASSLVDSNHRIRKEVRQEADLIQAERQSGCC